MINSKNPVAEWLENLFRTAQGFDERVLYVDGMTAKEAIANVKIPDDVIVVSDGKARSISEGFNHVVGHAEGEWIIPFCDDDHFRVENLAELIALIKSGKFDFKDVIHFPVVLPDGSLWGAVNDFSLEEIKRGNLIPHACFIRKTAFHKMGGYVMDACADWNFWIRAKMMPLRFEGYPKPIYHYRIGHERSAFTQQLKENGGLENIHAKVLENAR